MDKASQPSIQKRADQSRLTAAKKPTINIEVATQRLKKLKSKFKLKRELVPANRHAPMRHPEAVATSRMDLKPVALAQTSAAARSESNVARVTSEPAAIPFAKVGLPAASPSVSACSHDEAYYAKVEHAMKLREQGVDATFPMSFVKEHLGTSHSTLYREIKRGNFPAAIKAGHMSSWRFSEIEAYRLGTPKNTVAEAPQARDKELPAGGGVPRAAERSQRQFRPPSSESEAVRTSARQTLSEHLADRARDLKRSTS